MNEDGKVLEVRRVSCFQPDLRIYCSKQAPQKSLKRCPAPALAAAFAAACFTASLG